MPPERLVDGVQPVDGGDDGLAYGDTGTFLRVAGGADASAEAGGVSQFVEERVALGVQAVQPSDVGPSVGLVDFLLEFGEPSTVGVEGLPVDDVAEPGLDGDAGAADQIERGQRLVQPAQQLAQVAEAA